MKITGYPAYSAIQPSDLLLLVANVDTDPANKKVSLEDFFGNVCSNTNIDGNFSVQGNFTVAGNTYTVTSSSASFVTLSIQNLTVASNGFIISEKFTPANSSISEAGSAGKISFDDDYLYVKTANNETKRIALQSF